MKTLRFGLMIDSYLLTKWQRECISKLVESGCANLELIIINKQKKKPRKLKEFFSYFLYYLLRIICFPDACRSISCEDLLENIPSLYCEVFRMKSREFFYTQDIALIRNNNLDFILRFGFGILDGAILESAQYGIWSFHHGDERIFRGLPAGFWEIFHGKEKTGAVLQRLTHSLDSGVILKRISLPTMHFSYTKQLQQLFHSSIQLPLHACFDIVHGSEDINSIIVSNSCAQIYRRPKNAQVLFFIWKIFRSYFTIGARYLFYSSRWNIGIIKKPISSLVFDNEKMCIEWMPDLTWRAFRADPFGMNIGNKAYIFYEYMPYFLQKGEIRYAVIHSNGIITTDMRVEDMLKCHISYPFIFIYNNTFYCIPETSQDHALVLYKFDTVTKAWIFISCLINNIVAVDPTVFQYSSLWWLSFSTGVSDLNLYYSESPLFGWKPHPLNPVKVDVASSRPAGTPFINDGILYRPAQDCSKRYGSRIAINKIIQLTPELFEEECITYLEPLDAQYKDGIHTVSHCGSWTLIDGKEYFFAPQWCISKALALLREPR